MGTIFFQARRRGRRSSSWAVFVSASSVLAWTKAGIDSWNWHFIQYQGYRGQGWHFRDSAPLALWSGLKGYPVFFTGTQGNLGGGALCIGTRVVGHMGRSDSRKPCPFGSTSQGVSPWRWGVAGSSLARTALVGVRAPDSGSLACASGQRGHCWSGGRAAWARPLLTKLPAVVEPGRQALAPSPVSFLPQDQHEWG